MSTTNIIPQSQTNNTNNSIDINDEYVTIAKTLFKAWFTNSIMINGITEMASILLSTTTLQLHPSSSTTPTVTPTKIVIQKFMELRSQYIGTIDDTTSHSNSHNDSKKMSNETTIFNVCLFHAALISNSPVVIDAIMPYINFDFTTLDLPQFAFSEITTHNAINYEHNDEICQTNYILEAIVNATTKGHCESIKHLITNYKLSPTVQIFDFGCISGHRFTTLLFYASRNDNYQIIEYLLPLCYRSTNPNVLTKALYNIAKHGFFTLLKKCKEELKINIERFYDGDLHNILYYAARSNNTELLDYLIQKLGMEPNSSRALQSAMEAQKFISVHHLLTNYKLKLYTPLFSTPLGLAVSAPSQDINITIVDFIIKTYPPQSGTLEQHLHKALHESTIAGNISIIKHLVQQYKVNPKVIFDGNISLLHWALTDRYIATSTPLIDMVQYLINCGLDVNQRNAGGYTPIKLAVEFGCQSNEISFPVFKLLLQHGAKIDDIYDFMEDAINNNHWLTIQWLIETYQPSINVNKIRSISGQPLLHAALCADPLIVSIDFITFLISMDKIDINEIDKNNKTPIQYAMSNKYFDPNVIKLLIQNGAKVTVRDWLIMFGLDVLPNPYDFCECLDYFKDTFGWDIETFSLSKDIYSNFKTTPLLLFSSKHLQFRYSTIKFEHSNFNKFLIYRALIHRYKANINDQSLKTKATTLHYSSSLRHVQLLEFTLLNSHYKPNIQSTNTKGETFLHVLISNIGQWYIDTNDKDQRESKRKSIKNMSEVMFLQYIDTDYEINEVYQNFENVIDAVAKSI